MKNQNNYLNSSTKNKFNNYEVEFGQLSSKTNQLFSIQPNIDSRRHSANMIMWDENEGK